MSDDINRRDTLKVIAGTAVAAAAACKTTSKKERAR